MLLCPICERPMLYQGFADGGGEYGTAICDYFECPDCEYIEEVNCVEEQGGYWPESEGEQ